MKALKLSSIALCLLGMFSSCTKDSLTSQDNLSLANSKTGVLGEPSALRTAGGNIKPDMVVIYNPDPGVVGQEVVVTGKFDPASTKSVPQCGTIGLEELINGEWVKVVLEEKQGKDVTEVEVTSTVQSVTYTFTPTKVGDPAHTFRAVYKANEGGGENCDGYIANHSEGFDLKVIDPCVNTFMATGKATAVPVATKPGVYEFTVTFELTSPRDIANVKFQGGATSGGQFEHILTDPGSFSVKNNNQNSVLTWEGPLSKCVKKTLTFKFQRRFSCPATEVVVTGNWSAKDGEIVLAENVTAAASCQ